MWIRTPLRRCVLDTTLCDKVCQRLAAGRCFSPVSSTKTTDRHDITEILLKVALNTITLTSNPSVVWLIDYCFCFNFVLYFTGLTKLQVVIREMSQETGKVFHIRHATGKNMREILMEAKRKQWTNIIADLSSKQTALLLKMVKYSFLPNKWKILKLLLLWNF